jgi:hypothetical protein
MTRAEAKKIIEETRSRISVAGNNSEFEGFVKEKRGSKARMSKGNISKLYKSVCQTPGKYIVDDDVEKLVLVFQELAEEYVNDVTGTVRRFFGTNYHLYFYWRAHKNPEANEPYSQLGRAVLRLKTGGVAELQNVPDYGQSVNYSGRFNVDQVNTLTVTLASAYEGRTLTIKAGELPEPSEYAVGSTISIERKQVVNNMIILEQVEEASIKPPKLLTYRDGADFTKDIPIEIRRFLSRRRLSYLRTPSQINSLSNIHMKMGRYNQNKRALSISPDIPLVYVSTPVGGVKGLENGESKLRSKLVAVAEIVRDLVKHFGEKKKELKFRLPGSVEKYAIEQSITIPSRNVEFVKDLGIAETFEELSYTKYFVLIYDENVPSRSLIDLGAALQSATVVIVIYRRGKGFPDSVRVLKERKGYRPMITTKIRNSVAEEKEEIYETIEEAIDMFY